MKRIGTLSLAVALATWAVYPAIASTAYGDLNNFDTVNDTGQECHGFEIELDGIHSTDITYTYDWNHYGAPRIREDNSDSANPKVFVRYESAKNADGSWAAYTAVPSAPLAPTDGHSCTDPSVNLGCEHFGVGYYGAPTAVIYHWLVDDGLGNLVYGPAVNVATPSWVYAPPDPGGQPAQVVAVIPAPEVPVDPGKQYGVPVWVKVIKTTTHNANDVALDQLVSADADEDGIADWQNQEPAETETEWKLLQANTAGNVAKEQEEGLPDDMGDGSATVTRRYEFYQYAAAADTLDGENGEAMCSEVDPVTDPNDPAYLHGVGESVEVTDANGDSYFVNCAAQVVVGDYVGAQMAGFDAEAALGLIDSIQDGELSTPYTPRTVVVGGNSPYTISILGDGLPPGLTLSELGVLSGTPTAAGAYAFTVQATDADDVTVSGDYAMGILGTGIVRALTIEVRGSGSGAVDGSGVECVNTTCTVNFDEGATASLSATPDADSAFSGWGGACAGTAGCDVTMNADTTVTATFTRQYSLTVANAGGGTVTGGSIDCGTSCSARLDQGAEVSLTATPDSGNLFAGWSGACSGSEGCTVSMDADKAVTATFIAAPSQYTLIVEAIGKGRVTSDPRGINCGRKCAVTIAADDNVTLTAKPVGKDKSFLGWGGDCSSSGNALTCTLQMTGDRNVIANFN